MQALTALVTLPLLILNSLGLIVAAVWLAVLGEWTPLVVGVVAVFLLYLISIILILPAAMFSAPAVALMSKGQQVLAFPFVIAGSLYVVAIMTAWCFASFYWFNGQADRESFWPLLLMSYEVAVGPWVVMARKELEAGSTTSIAISFFVQIAYIGCGLLYAFVQIHLYDLATIFVVLMVIGSLFQGVINFQSVRGR